DADSVPCLRQGTTLAGGRKKRKPGPEESFPRARLGLARPRRRRAPPLHGGRPCCSEEDEGQDAIATHTGTTSNHKLEVPWRLHHRLPQPGRPAAAARECRLQGVPSTARRPPRHGSLKDLLTQGPADSCPSCAALRLDVCVIECVVKSNGRIGQEHTSSWIEVCDVDNLLDQDLFF
ncbi:unnamed protein product, partial [Urochloa humidicola]